MMTAAIISLPKKDVKSFWHPESQELILTAAALTTVFSFWNAVNIRPAILTDPGYNDQAGGIIHHMNLSMAVILGISAAFAVLYGEKGYLPSAAAVGTGAVMYVWTKSELDRHFDSRDAEIGDISDADASGLRIHTDYPALYRPMVMQAATLTPKRRKEMATS